MMNRVSANIVPPLRPARPLLRRVTTVALSLACVCIGGCQNEQPGTELTSSPGGIRRDATASGCDVQPGDVSTLQGATFEVDTAATIRAGLQYVVSQDPLTWKVMFLTDAGSISYDVKRGDTVSVAGQTITVRDVCADRVVLAPVDAANGTGAPGRTS